MTGTSWQTAGRPGKRRSSGMRRPRSRRRTSSDSPSPGSRRVSRRASRLGRASGPMPPPSLTRDRRARPTTLWRPSRPDAAAFELSSVVDGPDRATVRRRRSRCSRPRSRACPRAAPGHPRAPCPGWRSSVIHVGRRRTTRASGAAYDVRLDPVVAARLGDRRLGLVVGHARDRTNPPPSIDRGADRGSRGHRQGRRPRATPSRSRRSNPASQRMNVAGRPPPPASRRSRRRNTNRPAPQGRHVGAVAGGLVP